MDSRGRTRTFASSEISIKIGRAALLHGHANKSFRRVARDEFDAGDAHALDGTVAGMRGRGGDFFQHVIALDQLPNAVY
jgi:hypothetical protein